jgi:hypothetical protein
MPQRMRPPTETASQDSQEDCEDGKLQDGSDPDARRDVARSSGASRDAASRQCPATRSPGLRVEVAWSIHHLAANDGVELTI